MAGLVCLNDVTLLNPMTGLPIDDVLGEVLATLRQAASLVLVAPPGAGKTTRVPPAILRSGFLAADHPNIVLLQPRRVAARAVAMRIAEENGWELGGAVGYHVRFDRKISRQTRLHVLTEGILTRQLLDDPLLDGVGCVILDEFHERSLNSDLAIALLREVQEARDDFKLVVMSATLEAEPVAKYLGGCPIIHSEGRTFPVQIDHRAATGAALEDRVAAAVADSAGAGDTLVFLPGIAEINRCIDRLAPLAQRDQRLLLPLHGSLRVEEQIAAIRPADQPKIICSTNIAETSLTIEGVTTVIDSGLARIARYDAERGLDRLDLSRISRASATQRAGRAGRVRPGRCVRLYSAKDFAAMADFGTPEIARVDLAQTILALHAWGRPDPRVFGWYDPPPEQSVASAERLLAMLGALDGESGGRITELGGRILALPVHPRLARLLLAAGDAGMLETGATVAALLSEKDIFLPQRHDRDAIATSQQQGDSDLLVRLEALQDRSQRDLDRIAVRQVLRVKEELLRIAGHRGTGTAPVMTRKARATRPYQEMQLPLLAYPDRVCRRRGDSDTGVMVGGGGVRIARESVVRQGEFFVALDARQDARSQRGEALVRIASRIEEAWLEALFPHVVRTEQSAEFDPQRQRVVGISRVWYRDLLLREQAGVTVDDATAGAVLAEVVRSRGRQIVESDESAGRFLKRLAFLRKHLSDDGWPAFDDAELGELLASATAGRRSVAEIRHSGLLGLLQSAMPYALLRRVDVEAPEAIAVPTGNRIRLDYDADPPVLAVRLQEMFSQADTPRLAGGRVPVVLHLLGPNFRPVQVTTDLASFWKNTYPQVRKDLRARYPKHAWPDDPLTAAPQAKGGRSR